MTKYDPKSLQDFALQLEAQSVSVAPKFTFSGILVGVIPAVLLLILAAVGVGGIKMLYFAIPAFIAGAAAGGFAGFQLSKIKVARMQHEIQTILCLLHIEKNTRGVEPGVGEHER